MLRTKSKQYIFGQFELNSFSRNKIIVFVAFNMIHIIILINCMIHIMYNWAEVLVRLLNHEKYHNGNYPQTPNKKNRTLVSHEIVDH